MSVVFPYLVLKDDPKDVADTRVFGAPKIEVKPRMVIARMTKRGTAGFILFFLAVVAILFSLLFCTSFKILESGS